jgi:protein-histidine pros-kinase
MAVRFLPHSVPSWSAQTVLHQVQKDFPDYSYKEAALNPTNPSDRATPWEADITNVFKRDRELAEFVTTRDPPGPFRPRSIPVDRPRLSLLSFDAGGGACNDG